MIPNFLELLKDEDNYEQLSSYIPFWTSGNEKAKSIISKRIEDMGEDKFLTALKKGLFNPPNYK